MALSRIPDLRAKKILWGTLVVLRVLLAMAVVAYFAVEYIEFNSNKEILHLTMFSMFLLLSNLLIDVGRHKAAIRTDEHAQSLFWVAMFALCAAMLELVDLALDQVLQALRDPSMVVYFNAVSLTESLIGVFAVLMVYFSVDRFLVILRSITFELRHIGLKSHIYHKNPSPSGRGIAAQAMGLQPGFFWNQTLRE